ncbi:MAG: 3-hydroxyisobutyrate dehydrogenase [Geminicoccaceae bacterium]|nr:MAG: 3-hydroxyisobutyrate dehydrogenase [Geminicoccaceae bacterium]
MRKDRLGFVGLGAMGAPIARRLAAAGFPVALFDRDPARLATLEGTANLSRAADLAELERDADILLTCLPSEKAVCEVAAALRRPVLFLLDLSTVRPTTARTLHAELAGRGIRYVECPSIGGPAEAEAGTLLLLLSGDPTDIERIRPLLPTIGNRARIVGGPGAASRVAIVASALGLVQLAAIAEALALLAADGGDLDGFVEALAEAGETVAKPCLATAARRMGERRAAVTRTLRIAAKDAALAEGLAEEVGLDLPLFRRTAELFRAALGEGLGEDDLTSIARVVERETGLRIVRDATAGRTA